MCPIQMLLKFIFPGKPSPAFPAFVYSHSVNMYFLHVSPLRCSPCKFPIANLACSFFVALYCLKMFLCTFLLFVLRLVPRLAVFALIASRFQTFLPVRTTPETK